MWELDYKESWALKNWCFWTVVLEKTLESPFDCKKIQPVHPKGNQYWIFIGRTDAEAETPIVWLPNVKNYSLENPLMLGKIEADDRRCDDWMASLTWWTWVLVNSRSWWLTGRPGMLQSMGSHRVRHDWATELHLGSTSLHYDQWPWAKLPSDHHLPPRSLQRGVNSEQTQSCRRSLESQPAT